MEIKEYIKIELDDLEKALNRVLNGLTQQEMMWRPASGCNSMGLILYHTARLEDTLVQTDLQGKTPIWESEKWHQKMNLKKDEKWAGYTAEEVNSFEAPNLQDLLEYYGAVRQQTLEYLNNLDLETFKNRVKLPFGEFTIAEVISIIIRHAAQHFGEISYLRGMLRGMDK